MKMSLKVKLLGSFVVLITLPIIALAVLSYNMTADSMQETIEKELVETTRLTAESINQTVQSSTSLIQLQSKTELIRKMTRKSDSENKNIVLNMLQSFVSDNKDLIEMILITDENGIAYMNSSSTNEVTDLSDRQYVKDALNGKYSISDVITSKVTKEPVIAIAFPLLTDNQKVNGVLIGTVKFDKITEKAEQIKIGKSGYAYMVDKDGLLVSHPVKDKILKENVLNTGSTELKEYVKKMNAEETGSGYYTYEGIYKFVTFQPAAKWSIAVTANYDDYMAPAYKIRKSSIIISMVAIILAILAAYFISARIVNSIRKLQTAMELGGSGDLTIETSIQSKDELEDLSNSFNTMIDNQVKIIKQVYAASDELAAASEEMAASTEQVSTSSTEVAESTHRLAIEAENGNFAIIDTSKALLELSSLIQIAKNKATSADQSSQFTLRTANDGKETVLDVITRMEHIKAKMEETKTHISSLEQYSKEITSITDTITNLAEQTNLLALNAAIEAARAGEAGKGFAVVANEVRKLAEQSNSGATEVANLIRKVTETTANTVIATDQSSKQVEEGVEAVTKAGDALEKIVEAVLKTVTDVNGIVSVTDNEVATSEKIVELINSLATFIETTAASAEEVSASTEETSAAMETIASSTEQINAMALQLKTSIEKFKLTD
ncbi:methyl-accepting chemotaxis protein [Schinkia azotoformans MEV2011]|uniref:Methyl-accepting chemotaxis protein n=2 Tax=Schinkia azotoformans TaxID=1454 RepID=A0A072NPB4_SCHAZ|nr:methyl-accepting chemotaxis protein [Schinkia azotoformans]KEF39077.1 methyl-accepting chemotaxis protein [Schinkia azotoformans MEV2011]MEC1726319.1 methyl-accepting chemotaxis protein [Schinkia azotoformans]MEC1781169.1 methyl-accepting chemotaxis protein [Schinkia azotoformans]MED4331244.1 methyl-accepting chemotaxis protein [Schinkia azotoformans]